MYFLELLLHLLSYFHQGTIPFKPSRMFGLNWRILDFYEKKNDTRVNFINLELDGLCLFPVKMLEEEKK